MLVRGGSTIDELDLDRICEDGETSWKAFYHISV